jgi:Amt family ammonium transporter
MPPGFSAGDTAWVLASAALVLLMTPGLAFFYGGMVRIKSVLNMLMMSFVCIALVSVVWVLYGFTLAFGKDAGGGLIGGLGNGLMHGIGATSSLTGSVPTIAFAAFQLMFAIITPALISGAIADRAKFGAWVVFVVAWVSLVYLPVAHWVFASDGWINARLRALDFAGGTAVHINAGAAGLALAVVLGKRLGFAREAMRPHSLPLVMLGSGLLWFGWFGFNAGSAGAANGVAAMAFLNTQVATAAACLAWLAVEKLRDGHATSLGAASGAVAGLVAITPAAAAVSPLGAIAIGLIAGVACAYAVGLKYRLGLDDSLDVVGVHLVGGMVGSLLIGLFATKQMTRLAGNGQAGLFYGGGLTQLGRQALAVLVVASFSFALSWLLGTVIDKLLGFRISAEDEAGGIDLATHAETGYDYAGGGAMVRVLAGQLTAGQESTVLARHPGGPVNEAAADGEQGARGAETSGDEDERVRA